MDDIVVAVQAGAQQWVSPLQCDGAAQRWDLLDPTAAVLAATAQIVAGFLPVDVGVDPARGRPVHDMAWAVGEQPTAVTSPGVGHWSAAHVDQAQRHAAATRIDALGRVCAGVIRRYACLARGLGRAAPWTRPRTRP